MDFTLVEQIVTRLGVPVACTIVLLWIVLDAYKFARGYIAGMLKKQTEIMEKLVVSAETSSMAFKIFAQVLDKICATVSHLEVMAEVAERLKAGGANDAKTT